MYMVIQTNKERDYFVRLLFRKRYCWAKTNIGCLIDRKRDYTWFIVFADVNNSQKAKEYLNQINALFDKDLSITVLKSGITCEFDPNNKEKYFHSIYASSDTLKILKFLLTDNYRTKCLTTFIRRQFISKSKAYHLVNKLKGYLQSIHLDIDDYRVIDEYRFAT